MYQWLWFLVKYILYQYIVHKVSFVTLSGSFFTHNVCMNYAQAMGITHWYKLLNCWTSNDLTDDWTIALFIYKYAQKQLIKFLFRLCHINEFRVSWYLFLFQFKLWFSKWKYTLICAENTCYIMIFEFLLSWLIVKLGNTQHRIIHKILGK